MDTIIIDIKRSLSARRFSEEERVHHDAFNRACRIIDDQLKELLSGDTSSYDEIDYLYEGKTLSRKYGTISVFGDRGVGKTSFLLSIRDKYQADDNVAIMPFIDPTLIEEKGHIFLLIISIIDEMVRKRLDDADEQRDELKYEWVNIKKNLAKGLPSLDTVGLTYQEPQWQEDEYIMNQGIESVKAAFHLERNFHKLIDKALEILNKKALMMFFDDIDVDFKKGWNVLECIRKYLTSPKLIVLMSGNMKLYSKNVRRHQWENFGKAILKNEVDGNEEKIEEYTRLVNEIEGQYFLKILRSENRIYLYSLADNMRMSELTLKVKNDDGSVILLNDFYKKQLGRFGIIGAGSAEVFCQFLLRTSLRTQAHLMYQWQKESANQLSVISPFSSRMYAQSIDVDGAVRAEQIDNVILHYLTEQQLIEEAYLLTPNFENQDVNSAVTGFSMLFAQLIGVSPFLIFDYLIKIGCTRNYMHHLSYKEEEDNSVNRFYQATSIYQSKDLMSIYGNGLAYFQSINVPKPYYCEKDIYSYSEKAKKAQLEVTRIDDVLREVDGVTKLIGYMPLVSLLYGHKNERLLRYSFYAVLANIGQMLKAKSKEEMIQALTDACLVRNYQMLSKGQSAGEQGEADMDFELEFDAYSLHKLASEMLAWKHKFGRSKVSIPPYLLGRISTRFYYSSSNIANGTRGRKLGDYMSLLTMSFVNSILVEECRESQIPNQASLNTSNVQTSSKVLKDNLQYLIANAADQGAVQFLPLTKWILACPVLNAFLPDDIEAKVRTLLHVEEGEEGIFSRNIVDVIDRVLIKVGSGNSNR